MYGVNGLTPGKYIAVPLLDVAPSISSTGTIWRRAVHSARRDLSESEGKNLELVLKLNN